MSRERWDVGAGLLSLCAGPILGRTARMIRESGMKNKDFQLLKELSYFYSYYY